MYNHNVDLSSAFHHGYLLWCLPGKHGDVAHNHVRCIHARTGSQLVIRNGKIVTLTTLSSPWRSRVSIWLPSSDNKVASATNMLPAHYRDVIMGAMASQITGLTIVYSTVYCPASRTTLVATRFRVAVICPIIQVPHCIRVFFYFVWFVFINHIFQLYYELCTYCNILDIYLS